MNVNHRQVPRDSNRTSFVRIGRGFLCIAVGVMGLSCGSAHPESPQTAAAETAAAGQKAVLIAIRDTDFKKKIVGKLTNDFSSSAHLTVIDLAELDEHPTSDYDALVVMGARMGWLMYSVKERRFLRGLEEPGKVIMLMTAADADWKWERPDVDVITGASEPESLDPLYRELAARLDAILKK